MATYKKQLKDKDGNTIYPDVGIDLDQAIYGSDPTETISDPEPWIDTGDIKDSAVTSDKIDFTTFGVPVYIGKVGIQSKTYSNNFLWLQDKADLYKASGVSTEIYDNIDFKFTLPATGTYVVCVYSSLWTGSNSWDYMLLRITKNRDVDHTISRAMGPKISGAWGFVNCQGMSTIQNGDKLEVYLQTNGNNFYDGNVSTVDSSLQVMIYRVS